jgi:hypothetical protein
MTMRDKIANIRYAGTTIGNGVADAIMAAMPELNTHRGDDVHPVEAAIRLANVLRPNDLLASGPTDAAVNDVCLSYRHDFGLLDVELQNGIRMDARSWYEAWTKLLDHLPAAPTEGA